MISCCCQVESFEEGQLISRYVNNPGNPHNVKLAGIGLDSYLKMLLKDNFIHADLHPGNILVRCASLSRHIGESKAAFFRYTCYAFVIRIMPCHVVCEGLHLHSIARLWAKGKLHVEQCSMIHPCIP